MWPSRRVRPFFPLSSLQDAHRCIPRVLPPRAPSIIGSPTVAPAADERLRRRIAMTLVTVSILMCMPARQYSTTSFVNSPDTWYQDDFPRVATPQLAAVPLKTPNSKIASAPSSGATETVRLGSIAFVASGELKGELGTVEDTDPDNERLTIRILSNRLISKSISEVKLRPPQGVCVMLRVGKYNGRFGVLEGFNDVDHTYLIRFASGNVVREGASSFQVVPDFVEHLSTSSAQTKMVFSRACARCLETLDQIKEAGTSMIHKLHDTVEKPCREAIGRAQTAGQESWLKLENICTRIGKVFRRDLDFIRDRIDAAADRLEQCYDSSVPVLKEVFMWSVMQWLMQGRPALTLEWAASCMRNWIVYSTLKIVHSRYPMMLDGLGVHAIPWGDGSFGGGRSRR